LDHGKHFIRQIFKVLAEKSNYPVLIHCSAGKDRTGLVVAMLQVICGLQRADVIQHYAISEELLDLDRIKSELNDMGLPVEFAKSPPSVIANTLHYIDTKYGSVQEYLATIGISKQDQNEIVQLCFRS
jgi:protein tyrosine/serine phosphatase